MLERMELNGPVEDQLHQVLRDTRNPRYRDYLTTIRCSQQQLNSEAFRALFEYDTTWGLFGQRTQHFNEQLNVVALTHFVPHERETAQDADDVILMLTPIERILATLTAMTLKDSGFEGFAAKDLVLPQRPRTGVEMGRFTSLLDVACSVWLEICHAYVVHEQSAPLIRSIYCFNANRDRARLLWIDVAIDYEVSIKHASYAGHETTASTLCLVINPDEEPPARPSSDDVLGPLLCLQAHALFPWIELLWVRPDAAFFLLITWDKGHFTSFHRVVRGRSRLYPLWMHLLSDTEPERIKTSCSVCGNNSLPLIASPHMDPEPGNLYCGQRCIVQMANIRTAQAREEELKQKRDALRLRLPPQAK